MSKTIHSDPPTPFYRFTLGLISLLTLAIAFALFFSTMNYFAEQLSNVSYRQILSGFLTM